MSNPNSSHYTILERINNLFNLIGYIDLDWGGNLVDRKSTTRFIFTINNTSIS